MVPVRKKNLCRLMALQEKKGMPKRTWMEVVKIDLKCNLFEGLVMIDGNGKNIIQIVDLNNVVGTML